MSEKRQSGVLWWRVSQQESNLFFWVDRFLLTMIQKMCWVLSAEDSWSYVLRRRLEACGADLNRIGFLSPEDERFVDLNFNGDLLKGIIETNRPSVVVFDPLQAFVPENLRMGDRNAMRKCFSPLIGYGEQYKLTPIIIAHANKQSGVWGRKRIADSSDIWDASRLCLW